MRTFESLHAYVNNVADTICGERDVACVHYVIDVWSIAGVESRHGEDCAGGQSMLPITEFDQCTSRLYSARAA